VRIQEEIVVNAPVRDVWELLADPAGYPGLLDSVAAFDPEDSEQQPGPRARYTMRFAVGSTEVGGPWRSSSTTRRTISRGPA